MTKSTKIVAVAALTGFALTLAGLVATPFNTSASAAGQIQFDSAGRIDGAFASIAAIDPAPALKTAVLRAAKGDKFAPADCESAVWPNIDRACLTNVDGSPAPAVRTITIGYQEGDATTVLVRMPAPAFAAR
jgi:hypothetical protein